MGCRNNHHNENRRNRFVCECNEENNRRQPVTLFCRCHEVRGEREENRHHRFHENEVRFERDNRRDHWREDVREERDCRRNRRSRCNFCNFCNFGRRW